MARLAAGCLLAVVRAPFVAATTSTCSSSFSYPPKPPSNVREYDGEQMDDVCITHAPGYHVQVIGDWGGVLLMPKLPPLPADKRSKLFPLFRRRFVWGVDDKAQHRVRDVMERFASTSGLKPDYILNVGDNFYWGGVDSGQCGGSPTQQVSEQWQRVFEDVYTGSLAGIPWLGVLGNHDYGGYCMTAAWEQNIGYTWTQKTNKGNRWLTPATYWGQRVHYPTFSVDYLFVDTNVVEAWLPLQNMDHNICGQQHNPPDADCSPQGPSSVGGCKGWFDELWEKNLAWLVAHLAVAQRSTFQVIVTHFPAFWLKETWNCLSDEFGIDMHISGHIHHQKIYEGSDGENYIQGGTCSIVSGGGGGITSEGIPSVWGQDDQYGFVDLVLRSDKILAQAISHSGVVRKLIECPIRHANPGSKACAGISRRLLGEQIGMPSNMTNFV